MSKKRHLMAVAAHLLLRDPDGKLLFVRRANTGYADGQWSVPAGHVEVGESLAEACAREAKEEVGVVVTPEDLQAQLVQHKRDDDLEERIDVFFLAPLPTGTTPEIREPEHCDGLQWCDPATPPDPVVAYLGHALQVIRTRPNERVAYFGF